MYRTAKNVGFVCVMSSLVGFPGLIPSCLGLVQSTWGSVLGSAGYSAWLVQGAAQELVGWKCFFPFVACFALVLLGLMWFRKTEQRLKRLFLSWQ